MGLFTKKDPCAICGGKVSGLFPSKIDGQLICKECHGTVDLPEDMEKHMSLEQFKAYREFREENNKLKADFVTSQKVEFGWLGPKLVVDLQHGRFCFATDLDSTIYLGEQLKSITVKEDNDLLYSGNANEVVHYRSAIPDRILAMTATINGMNTSRAIQGALDTLARELNNEPGHGPDDRQGRPEQPSIDLPKVFEHFYVELRFEGHPYWDVRTFTVNAPEFNSQEPSVNDYMQSYNEKVALLDTLVSAISQIAFPNAAQRSA